MHESTNGHSVTPPPTHRGWRQHRWHGVALLVYVLVAWLLVRDGLGSDAVLGHPWGEVWGRLFVTAQVARWPFEAAPGMADLLSAPDGRVFWPVDPAWQLVAVPLRAIFGGVLGYNLGIFLLFLSGGVGAGFLARTLGAGPWQALTAGCMVELSPLLLRHAAEGVTEVLALGLLCGAVALGLRVAHTRASHHQIGFALAVLALAGSSPYYAVYGAMGLALMALRWPRARPLLLAAVALGAVVALPLLLAETGPGGRLSSSGVGGYALVPDVHMLLALDGTVQPAPRPPLRGVGEVGRQAHGLWQQLVVGAPGGLGLWVVLLLGLRHRRARGWAAMGLAVLALGPVWVSLGHRTGVWHGPSPLQWVLSALPGTSFLGNEARLVAVPLVLAVGVLATLVSRWEVIAAALAVALTAWVELPPMALPTADDRAPRELFDAVRGPVVQFPDADPPLWNPQAWPKEGLWFAAEHGAAQGYDYGRGGEPRDAVIKVHLAALGGVPLARAAAETLAPSDADAAWRGVVQAGFRSVLITRAGLGDEAYAKVVAGLERRLGPAASSSAEGAVWHLAGLDTQGAVDESQRPTQESER